MIRSHEAHKLELKEHALNYLTHVRDRMRQQGKHETADTMTKRIRDLWLECNAIRQGRP